MAAFKKIFLMLALVLVALAGAGNTAYAQHGGVVTCTAFAVPPTVRVEGIAELVGDIIANCTSTVVGGSPNFVTNVTVTLNTNVTNNINFGAGTSVTDAVLIINEATPGTPTATITPGTVPTTELYGTLLSTSTLQWAGATIPTPGAGDGAGGTNPTVTTVRVSNVRANASQFNAGPSISSQIVALLTFTGPTTIPITNNVLNVAIPLVGLLTKFSDPVTIQQCICDDASFYIKLTEGFPTAFKTLGEPHTTQGITQVEDGYHTPESGVNEGGASQGTRFIFRFYNVPSGVKLSTAGIQYADTGSNGHTLTLVRVTGTDANGAGGAEDAATTAISVDASGFGYAVFEVTDDDPFATESIKVWFTTKCTPDTGNDKPAVGTMQASASFAPLSTVTTASKTAPEPRFVDTGVNTDILTVVRCFTNLLFPFVTNQAGFDTGFSIANTSADDKGTDGQQGACTLYYYGETTGGGAAPPSQTSIIVGAGKTIVWTLSGGNAAAGLVGAPGFQGYIFALCQFQFAHGFAFITDGYGGVQTLAEGYLALIVPWDGVPGSRFPGFGESLGH